jgi:hypothetical protein
VTLVSEGTWNAKQPPAVSKHHIDTFGDAPRGWQRKVPGTKALRAMQDFHSKLLERVADSMPDKTWVVFLNRPQLENQVVVAANVIVIDDHLIFTNSKGELAGLFLIEVVASYSEVPS